MANLVKFTSTHENSQPEVIHVPVERFNDLQTALIHYARDVIPALDRKVESLTARVVELDRALELTTGSNRQAWVQVAILTQQLDEYKAREELLNA